MVTEMSNSDSNRTRPNELRFPMMENAEYQKAQNQEIKLGKEEGLDVSIYSNPEFNWLQMEQIRTEMAEQIIGIEGYIQLFFQAQTQLLHLHPVVFRIGIGRNVQLLAQADPDFMNLRSAHIVLQPLIQRQLVQQGKPFYFKFCM